MTLMISSVFRRVKLFPQELDCSCPPDPATGDFEQLLTLLFFFKYLSLFSLFFIDDMMMTAMYQVVVRLTAPRLTLSVQMPPLLVVRSMSLLSPLFSLLSLVTTLLVVRSMSLLLLFWLWSWPCWWSGPFVTIEGSKKDAIDSLMHPATYWFPDGGQVPVVVVIVLTMIMNI